MARCGGFEPPRLSSNGFQGHRHKPLGQHRMMWRPIGIEPNQHGHHSTLDTISHHKKCSGAGLEPAWQSPEPSRNRTVCRPPSLLNLLAHSKTLYGHVASMSDPFAPLLRISPASSGLYSDFFLLLALSQRRDFECLGPLGCATLPKPKGLFAVRHVLKVAPMVGTPGLEPETARL